MVHVHAGRKIGRRWLAYVEASAGVLDDTEMINTSAFLRWQVDA